MLNPIVLFSLLPTKNGGDTVVIPEGRPLVFYICYVILLSKFQIHHLIFEIGPIFKLHFKIQLYNKIMLL